MNRACMKHSGHRLGFESLEDRQLLSAVSGDYAVLQNRQDSQIDTITVTLLTDETYDETDGEITLREAIDYAADGYGSMIRFQSSGTINLQSELLIGASVSIDALPVGGITLDGQNKCAVFVFDLYEDEMTVELAGMTIINGYSAKDGGGIAVTGPGKLIVRNSSLSNNTATELGGAIVNTQGNIDLYNCLITGNSAENGGGIYNSAITDDLEEGTEYSQGVLRLYNCTLSGNTVTGSGGGLYSAAFAHTYNSIIAGNTSAAGPGEFQDVFHEMNNIKIYGFIGDEYYESEISSYLNGFNTLSSFDRWTEHIATLTYNPNSELFVDVSAGDYRLGADSQALNSGSQVYFDEQAFGSQVDIHGNPRFNDLLDLGACEYYPQLTGVCTGVVNCSELVTSQALPPGNGIVNINEWSTFYLDLWGKSADFQIKTGEDSLQVSFVVTYDPALFKPSQVISTTDGISLQISSSVSTADSMMKFIVSAEIDQSFETTDILLGKVQFIPSTEKEAGVPVAEIHRDTSQVSRPMMSLGASPVNANIWSVPYDFDDSGTVDMTDFIAFARVFGQTTEANPDSAVKNADFNGDGAVNMNDFILFALNFNKRKTGLNTVIRIPASENTPMPENAPVSGEQLSQEESLKTEEFVHCEQANETPVGIMVQTSGSELSHSRDVLTRALLDLYENLYSL